MITLTPGGDRDYNSREEVVADFEAGIEFSLCDADKCFDGIPCRKSNLVKVGHHIVILRYNNLTQWTWVRF